jgi:hypothetical protein
MQSKVIPARISSFSQILIQIIAAVSRAGIKPEDVEEVFFGNVLSAK